MTDDHCDFRAMIEAANVAFSNAMVESSRPSSFPQIVIQFFPLSSFTISSKNVKKLGNIVDLGLALSYFLCLTVIVSPMLSSNRRTITT